MAKVIPPLFLAVSAFLGNLIPSRLIALERQQIGVLEAFGYSATGIALHCAKLVMIITALGLVFGGVAGAYLGRGLARMNTLFFSFPFLIFCESPDLLPIAGALIAEVGNPDDLETVDDLLLSDAVRVQVGAPARITGWGGPPIAVRVHSIDPAGFSRVSALGIEEQRVNTIPMLDQPAPRLGQGFHPRVSPEDRPRHFKSLSVPEVTMASH